MTHKDSCSCTVCATTISPPLHRSQIKQEGARALDASAGARAYQKPTYKIKLDLPKMKTLFDECVWGPFVSNEEPGPGSWDTEDRATIVTVAKGALKKHVCGDKVRFTLN